MIIAFLFHFQCFFHSFLIEIMHLWDNKHSLMWVCTRYSHKSIGNKIVGLTVRPQDLASNAVCYLKKHSGLEIIFGNLPVKMTSTNEFVSVIKQNVLVILPQKQEIS